MVTKSSLSPPPVSSCTRAAGGHENAVSREEEIHGPTTAAKEDRQEALVRPMPALQGWPAPLKSTHVSNDAPELAIISAPHGVIHDI